MIQKWIKDESKKVVPNLEWTHDFQTGEKDTGVVYLESPGQPTRDDFEMQFPSFTVYIETDKNVAEDLAWKVHDALHKRNREVVVIGNREFHIIFIESIPPIPVELKANRQQTYSINLQTIIRRVK